MTGASAVASYISNIYAIRTKGKQLWIRFNLPCDGNIQRKLHKIFRQDIKEWESRDLVKGAVLTYHFGDPTRDPEILYLCLDVPAVQTPHERNLQLPDEAISQIPSEIMNRITQMCSQNQVKLGIMDFEFDIASARERAIRTGESLKYYRNAPTEEILRFASVGTRIAISLLDEWESRKITVDNYVGSADCRELANSILSRLKKELGDDYLWLREAFHFVCNPMLLNDYYLWTLVVS